MASAYYIVKDENIDDAMQIVDNMMYENKKEIKKNYPRFARKWPQLWVWWLLHSR